MSESRTARATAARRRASEERRAAHLRERGWTCTPPDEQPEQLRAVLRPTGEAGSCLVVGPGDLVRSVEVIGAGGPMPRPSGDPAVLRRRFEPVDELLQRAGYVPAGALWTVGVDHQGTYAATWCTRSGQR